jgi:Carboxypeptidase regulatory-like domain
MTRNRNEVANRHQARRDFVLQPSDLERPVHFLVHALILACALLIVRAGFAEAPPLKSWQGYPPELFGELGWRGARLEFGLPTQSEEAERTNVTVVVTDAQTGQPINQARLTLEFTEPGDPSKLKRSKKLSYSAKTNAQGHYKFPSLPKGNIRLIVTAERHQTFSKEFELEKEDQVIEVKLKKPQPLL